MPPCYDFTTSPLYSATTAQLSFPSHFLFHKIHFPRPAGRPPVCCISVCLSVFACFPVAGELFFLLLCAVQSKTFVTFACLSDGNGVQRKDFLTTNRVWVRIVGPILCFI